MSSNVIDLPVVTKLQFDPVRLLNKAAGAGLTKVVIIGTYEGGRRYFASSVGGAAEVHWMVRRAMSDLDKIVDTMEAEIT